MTPAIRSRSVPPSPPASSQRASAGPTPCTGELSLLPERLRPALSQAGSSMTMRQLLALPPAVDVVTAGRALGIGRTTAYALARAGRFPCRVLTVGSSYRVPTADLLNLLGVHAATPPVPTSDEDARPVYHAHPEEQGRGLTATGTASVHRPRPTSGPAGPLVEPDDTWDSSNEAEEEQRA